MTNEEMNEIMSGTTEVFKAPTGLAAVVFVILIALLSLPFFGPVYDGCDIDLYEAYNDWNYHKVDGAKKPPDCEPNKGVGGFAPFGIILFIAILINFCNNLVQFGSWRPRPGLADSSMSIEETD